MVLHLNGPQFNRLPEVVLGARVMQSLVHISSGSSRAVSVRFSLFIVQLVCFGWLAYLVLRVAL
jgi:hypothetical protein